MATTQRGIIYPDKFATPSRQAFEDLATSADEAIGDALQAGFSQPRAEAAKFGPQSMTSGQVVSIMYDMPVDDNAGFWKDGHKDRLTVPAGLGGLYLVNWCSSFAAHATGTRVTYLRVNGFNTSHQFAQNPSGTSATSNVFMVMLRLNPGDYVTVAQYQNSGTSLATTNQSYPFLSLTRIGN